MNNKELVKKYYEMWNSQNFENIGLILDNDVRFRGSLDITANGIDGFTEYAKMILTAFPNLYHAKTHSIQCL